MNKVKYFIIGLFLTLLSGCSSVSTGGYYWGDYSSSYYDLLKAPTEQQLAKRIDSLQGIIEKSAELDSRVPPGIHAELAQCYMKQGLEDQAKNHFRSEMTLYPESEAFLRRLVDDL